MLVEYRALVGTLGKYVTASPTTSDLVYAFRDTEGNLQRGPDVQMRPWEWADIIGDTSSHKKHQCDADERPIYGTKLSIQNNTSIPMEMFEASMAGEGIRNLSPCSDDVQMNNDVFRSIFEEDIDSESMYERDWREGRVIGKKEGASNDENTIIADTNIEQMQQGKDTPTSHRSSPGLSIQISQGPRSTGTGPPSATTSSRRTQSPSVSSKGDSMDGGHTPSTTSNNKGKRKASSADSDEVGSTGTPDSSSRKGKGKTTAGRSGKTVLGRSMKKKK